MKGMVLATLFLVISALCSFPVQGAGLEVAEGVITTNIVDRAPADEVQASSVSVGRLYCFTRITGAVSDTAITHVWYRDGQEMARVNLPVRSSDWRTWSSKKILPQWTGEWKVEILDAEGNLLKTLTFNLV